MKYLKTYESQIAVSELDDDIKYLAKKQGTGNTEYIQKAIDHFKMSDEQLHNLKVSVEFNYLSASELGDVVNSIINGISYIKTGSERKFKMAYEKDFRTRVIKIEKPYPICFITWNKYPFDINKKIYSHEIGDFLDEFFYNDLNTFEFNDIIGEISAEWPFGKKYLVGKGRFMEFNSSQTLWEKYRGKTRESDFINVFDEKNIQILTKDEIDIIEMRGNSKKYNI